MAFVNRGTHANISRITYPSTGHLLFSTSKSNSILNVFMAWGLMRLGHSTAGWIHNTPFLLLDQSNQGAAGCAHYISGQKLVSKASNLHICTSNPGKWKKIKIFALLCTPHLFHKGVPCKPQAVMEESQKTKFSQTQTQTLQPLFLIDNQNNILQHESRFVMGEAEMQSCELLE